jgi:geranylgeranyl diphosphate synthase type II
MSSTETITPAAYVKQVHTQVEASLQDLEFPQKPAGLYDPVRHVLGGKGKRLRPVLLLLTAEAFGARKDEALPAALAVELFHNFTLVHDDIMDRAETRRGRPTVHIRWDQDTAILTGDVLMGKAYALLSQLDASLLPEAHRRFYRTVARLCEGQTLDTAFAAQADVSVAAYLDMIDRKTGALLESCFEIGGLIGGAPSPMLDALCTLGRELGRAFQIQDDLLDLVADDARWGKQIGGDLMEGKKTYLLLHALESATGADHAWFAAIVDRQGLPAAQVSEARERMQRLGVLKDARTAVEHHTNAALTRLANLPPGSARETLRWLVRDMQTRHH